MAGAGSLMPIEETGRRYMCIRDELLSAFLEFEATLL
jgi:hypothetical protein